jgi:hypothetical protein
MEHRLATTDQIISESLETVHWLGRFIGKILEDDDQEQIC